MKIAVIGGTGLIGSAIVAHLFGRGHRVISMSRSPDPSSSDFKKVDISKATSPSYWLPHLNGIEAVVNCAGVLQDSRSDSTSMVHHHGIANLFAACEQLKIRRFIHFSAIGVDRETPSAFSETKLHGDKALMESGLDWVILRPSVVIGRPAYGASALVRGLAALPATWVMPNTGQLQIVLLEDVVRTVAYFLDPGAQPTNCGAGRPTATLFYRNCFALPRLVSLAASARDPPPAVCFKYRLQIWGCDLAFGMATSRAKHRRERDRARGYRQPCGYGGDRHPTKQPPGIFRRRAGLRSGALVRAHVLAKAGPICCFVLVLDHNCLRFAGTRLGLWYRPHARGRRGRNKRHAYCRRRRAGGSGHWTRDCLPANKPIRPLCCRRYIVHLCNHRNDTGPASLGRS